MEYAIEFWAKVIMGVLMVSSILCIVFTALWAWGTYLLPMTQRKGLWSSQNWILFGVAITLGVGGLFLTEHIFYVLRSKEFIAGQNEYQQILLRQTLLGVGLSLIQLLTGSWTAFLLFSIVRSQRRTEAIPT